MASLLQFARLLDQLVGFVGRLSAWSLILLMLVIVADVTLRHWFVIGSTKLQELEWHLHGFLFLMCLGWAYSKNTHVRIELLSERLSAKTRAVIEGLGCLVFLIPYVCAVLYFGVDYVSYSLDYNEASPSPTGLPDRWIIKSAIVAGFGFLAVAAISKLLEAVVFLFGAPSLKEQTGFAHPDTQGGGS